MPNRRSTSRGRPVTVLLVLICCAAGLAPGTRAAGDGDASPTAFADLDAVHAAVQRLEDDPLREGAELTRALLDAHYRNVDYLICGDVLGPLASSPKEAHQAILGQIIFASGVWVETHPDRATDIDAYTLAGLEGGMRAYRNVLAKKPRARLKLLDELLELYEAGRLAEFVAEHPCRES